jgi:hypothetical protein
LRAELDPLARHPHVIAMDIVEPMHVLENAFSHAYSGRAPIRLRLVPDWRSTAGASGSSLMNALRLL